MVKHLLTATALISTLSLMACNEKKKDNADAQDKMEQVKEDVNTAKTAAHETAQETVDAVHENAKQTEEKVDAAMKKVDTALDHAEDKAKDAAAMSTTTTMPSATHEPAALVMDQNAPMAGTEPTKTE